MTAEPSGYAPMIMAPALATVMRNLSSRSLSLAMLKKAPRMTSYPTIRYDIRSNTMNNRGGDHPR